MGESPGVWTAQEQHGRFCDAHLTEQHRFSQQLYGRVKQLTELASGGGSGYSCSGSDEPGPCMFMKDFLRQDFLKRYAEFSQKFETLNSYCQGNTATNDVVKLIEVTRNRCSYLF